MFPQILLRCQTRQEYTIEIEILKERGGAAPFVILKRCALLRFMKNKLRRYYGKKDLHFITFSCFQRRSLLEPVRARNLFVKILAEVRERYPFLLVGYVVMSEHVHLLISEPAQGNPSKVIRILKQRVSRAMRQKRRRTSRGQLRLPFPEEGNGLKRFWQRRFYDLNVWSTGKLKEKLNYMHANPVVRRLVRHPKNWPWSSWSFYEKGEAGLIRIDPFG